MSLIVRRRAAIGPSVVAFMLVVLAVASLALAAVPRVDDKAGLFTAPAVEEANRIVERVYTETRAPHKDVLVVTLAKLPAGKEAREVAEAEFSARKSNGLLILLVKSPGKLWVTVGEDTRRGFPTTDVDELVNRIMLPRLRERKADEALLDGLRFVQARMEVFRAPAKPAAAAVPPVAAPVRPATDLGSRAKEVAGGIDWLWVIIIVLAVWVVIALLRALFRPRVVAGPGYGGGSGPGPGYGYAGGGGGGGGGGGWGTAILGGMFGALAGNWIYNHMLGGGTSAASGLGTSSAYAESPEPARSDEGVVGGGGGGDWGDTEATDDRRDFGGGGEFDQAAAGGGSDFSGGGDFGGSSDS